MKIVSCPACSQNVSRAAVSCPHCGHPFAPPQKSVAKGVFWGLVLFFIVLPIGIGIAFVVMTGTLVGFGKYADRQMLERKAERERTVADAQREIDEQERKDAEAREAVRRERAEAEWTPEAVAAREQQRVAAVEQRRLEQTLAESEEAKKREAKERPRREREARLAAHQLSQASNGLPSFQIEVAKRYMRGNGLPQDNALAKFWLDSACTNRESEATNLLKTLQR